MASIDFTTQELEDMANMACGRYDAMVDIAKSPKIPNRSQVEQIVKELQSLNDKLRPYYTGKDS